MISFNGFNDFRNLGKKAMATQTLFFIFMLFIFAGILFFGFKGIFTATDVISEGELIDIKSEISLALEFCEDGLNEGSKKIVEVSSKKFDMVCLLGENRASSFNSQVNSEINSELGALYSNGDYVVLMTGFFSSESVQVVSSFASDYDLGFNEDNCFEKDSTGVVTLEFVC